MKSLSFGKPASPVSQTQTPAAQDLKPNGAPPAQAAQPSLPGFMKTGTAAKQAVQQAEEATKHRREQASVPFRFWLKEGESATITFLDGNLYPDGDLQGMLMNPVYYEHLVKKIPKGVDEYPCTGDNEPCPLCQAGNRPRLVSLFTVIDHRKISGKQKTYENEVRLFPATQMTLARLQKLALTRGGLAHWTFEVSRTTSQSPNVGDMFDPIGKKTVAELVALYGEEKVQPINYAKTILYYTADELKKMGVGSHVPMVGSSVAAAGEALAKEI